MGGVVAVAVGVVEGSGRHADDVGLAEVADDAVLFQAVEEGAFGGGDGDGELGAAVQVNQVGSIFNLHFSDAPVTDFAAYSRSDRELAGRLHLAALNRGVVLAGRCMGCLSTPMSGAEIDTFVDAIRLAMSDLDLEEAQ